MELIEKNGFGYAMRLTKIIGLTLIVMLFMGIFVEFVVRGQLISWEDTSRTFTNVKDLLT